MKRFSINEFLWMVILALFSAYIYYLFSSGKIATYIHPKMFKYVMFAFIVFLTLAIFQIRRIFSGKKNEKLKIGFLIFLMPLVLAFTLDPSNLGEKVISNKRINISNNVFKNSNKDIKEESSESISADTDKNTVDAEMFKDTLSNIYDNFKIIKGSEVEITGFIYTEEGFPKNRFVVSRLMVGCCAADAEIIGVLCEVQNGEEFQKDKWVKVKGTIGSTVQHNQYTDKKETIPIIKVNHIEEVEKPLNQYVYP